MHRWRYKFYQFMQGRRGIDQFSHFLFGSSAVLLLISIFVYIWLIYDAGIVLCIYGIFRSLSKNIYKREQENNRFLAMKARMTGGRNSGGRRTGGGYGNGQSAPYDMLHYTYFKCPICGQKLRAPRRKGKIKITCQNCGHVFEKKV